MLTMTDTVSKEKLEAKNLNVKNKKFNKMSSIKNLKYNFNTSTKIDLTHNMYIDRCVRTGLNPRMFLNPLMYKTYHLHSCALMIIQTGIKIFILWL